MIPFSLQEPESLADARTLLDPENPGVRALSGGTALMLLMRSGVFQPERLVSLRRIEKKYRHIAIVNDELHIGAMASLSALEHSPHVHDAAPMVTQALKRLSNVRVRNVATIGGHLAHGDPHMDLPPVLTALNAHVTVIGDQAERRVAVESLYRGYFETSLAANELIVSVHVPVNNDTCAAYMKCTTRSADDWPALGVAVAISVADSSIKKARIVIGAATDQPTVLDDVADVLLGAKVDAGQVEPERLREAGDIAAQAVSVRADAQGSASYKRELVRVYVARAISAAAIQQHSRPSRS